MQVKFSSGPALWLIRTDLIRMSCLPWVVDGWRIFLQHVVPKLRAIKQVYDTNLPLKIAFKSDAE